ncbi:uncharacterized protein LOC122019780 isoform X3 [Zingiber officinale]|uniref:uncharacterized protein LOC122019780 isoform X3 n=1 Tax=Zingiber officinale TaxID=94328 RepID=UPI001C4ADC12|nr:uncharacterized protein LOC122019780 isoform X3 [Zingiber officinale]
MKLRTALVSPCSLSRLHIVGMVSSKKSQSKSSSSNNNNHDRRSPDQAPPRITSNVKQNLQFLKIWKDIQRQGSTTPRPATSYRKKKVVKEEIPRDTELYKDPTMNLYYTNQGLETAVPVLLVDGYNVCGYWAKLKKHFIKGKLDIARQKLIDELITFSAIKEVKVVVVFDAMMSGLPTHKENFGGIDVIFSCDMCADYWIEKEGAFVWSCKALVSEIKASQKEFEQMLNEHRSTSMQGKLLQHNLEPEIVHALKDLKRKLLEKESI